MNIRDRVLLALLGLGCLASLANAQQRQPRPFLGPLRMEVPPISTDASVNYDFPIVYVRAPRSLADGRSRWAEVGDPRTMEPGADLVILYPDGMQEVLVPVNEKESIADPQVSFSHKSGWTNRSSIPAGTRRPTVFRIRAQGWPERSGGLPWVVIDSRSQPQGGCVPN